MKKQIIYPEFIPRLLSTTIDLVLLFTVLAPIINFISKYIFLYIFHDFFIENFIDTSSSNALAVAVTLPEFINHVTWQKFFTYFISVFILNTVLMAAYFIICWYKFGATLGKMFMRMKIVDADSYVRPSLCQFIKRFFAYITAFLGIWYIMFSKSGMALHDRIANTVVIKS